MDRVDFSPQTIRLIRDRAGHQCSFPTCSRRTISAESSSQSTSNSGIAAHIFSASAGGPRGQGGLTVDELAQQSNGIWLCSDHAKIIDNNRGSGFPPETLLSYKALQEARVIREVQGLYSPIGWIHKIEILQNFLFSSPQKIHLAKLNLLYGQNGTGKTALTEWIIGAFDHGFLYRWGQGKKLPLSYRISYLNPSPQEIEITLSGKNQFKIIIDRNEVPFNPIGLRCFRIESLSFSNKSDDVSVLSEAIGLSKESIRRLAIEVNKFPYRKVHNSRFVVEDGQEILRADVDGTVPGLCFRSLSGREAERVLLEFATAAARVSGRYHPTILILDGFPSILFEGFFEFYSHHLLDPENQFQTIMCIPTQNLNLDAIRWNGWEVIRTEKASHGTLLTQELRLSGK